jgi:hypothetical protein
MLALPNIQKFLGRCALGHMHDYILSSVAYSYSAVIIPWNTYSSKKDLS